MVSAPTLLWTYGDLVLPPIWDELWAEHGSAVRAAQLAAVEAEADTVEAMGDLL